MAELGFSKTTILGRLGIEPDVRYTKDKKTVANFTVATSENWKDDNGDPQERTEWHRVVMFGPLADIARQYLNKGSKVLIEGQNRTRDWLDNDNVKRYTTEIIVDSFNGSLLMLDNKSESEESETKSDSETFNA